MHAARNCDENGLMRTCWHPAVRSADTTVGESSAVIPIKQGAGVEWGHRCRMQAIASAPLMSCRCASMMTTSGKCVLAMCEAATPPRKEGPYAGQCK
jgi:hypothetical protein